MTSLSSPTADMCFCWGLSSQRGQVTASPELPPYPTPAWLPDTPGSRLPPGPCLPPARPPQCLPSTPVLQPRCVGGRGTVCPGCLAGRAAPSHLESCPGLEQSHSLPSKCWWPQQVLVASECLARPCAGGKDRVKERWQCRWGRRVAAGLLDRGQFTWRAGPGLNRRFAPAEWPGSPVPSHGRGQDANDGRA